MTNSKRLFILLFLFSVLQTVNAETPLKSQELGFARIYARDFLTSRGADPASIDLRVEEYTDRLVFFNDMRNNLFLLMVRDAYAENVKESVLAFSIGTPHSKARDTETFMHMMSYYDTLIRQMHDGLLPKEQTTEMEELRIMPIMNVIRWRQFGLRDVFDNQQHSVLSGCGAVAVGQLMAFYEWPDTVRRDFSYTDSKGKVRGMQMDGTKIDWSSMKNIYFYQDKDSDSIAPLMKMVSKAMMVDYGERFTVNWSDYIKRAMITHFCYSPEMFLVSRKDVTEDTMMRLICCDLRAGRPCLLSGGEHQFVCDGVFDGFLHLNMGWNGSYDGWYRFPVVTKSNNSKAFIETALLNIKPEDIHGKDTVITLAQAGTLVNVLTQGDCAGLSRLKLQGPINGNDIRLLRRMAGYVGDNDYFSWKGRLVDLDLSEAEIVNDSASYFEADAKKTGVYFRLNGENYDFRTMTHAKWLRFNAQNKPNPAFYIKEIIVDSIYTMFFKTRAKYISRRMFEGCENLQKLRLPKNTVCVEYNAFTQCYALREIMLPASVTCVQSAFWDCRSLEHIYVCKDAPYIDVLTRSKDNTVFSQSKSPQLKIEVNPALGVYAAFLRQDQKERPRQQTTVQYTGQQVYPQKFIARYKVVNGKKVLVKRTPIK